MKSATNTLQTLDRGLQALSIISQEDGGVSIAELADQLQVHRAIVYRIVTTLEMHALVHRTREGSIRLGAGATLLASRFEPRLRAVAHPLIHDLARRVSAHAFISVTQGDECMVIMVAEPDDSGIRVGYRIGSRHPLTQGAAGIAILSGRAAQKDEPSEVSLARLQGYSLTQGQLQSGAIGVASPLHNPDSHLWFEACVGVVAMNDLDVDVAVEAVKAAAALIAQTIGG